MPASSSSSSRSPSPSPLLSKKASSSNHEKKKSGKNEGVDPNWAFKPPPSVKVLEFDNEEDEGEFDWESVNDDKNNEVWLIRIPEGVKPKYLQGLTLQIPDSKKASVRTTKIGTLPRKHISFDVWSLGEGDVGHGRTADDTVAASEAVSAEEMKGLTCLLPRKAKGKLFPTPRPIARQIVLSAQAALPTPAPSPAPGGVSVGKTIIAGTETSPEVTGPPYKNPERKSYPTEILKHQFMPYGSLTPAYGVGDVTMESDVAEAEAEAEAKIVKRKPKKELSPVVEIVRKGKSSKGDSGGKKRKGDEEASNSQKKPKKAKTDS
ncbi:hypothetical protein AX16_008939 [Volvariella volvacea WC 439]|nr:hypothetical protein AX16_008939 [Volvariella volvacea WC 439]